MDSQTTSSNVKRAQELAMSGEDPPSAYIIKGCSLESVTNAEVSIPIIDFSILESSSSKKRSEEMEKLQSALFTWGMFQVTGHGIPTMLIDELLEAAKGFFHLPMEEKKKVCRNSDDGTTDNLEYGQGYGGDNFPKGQVLDWMDRLLLNLKPQHHLNLNLWPRKPNNFREVFGEFGDKSSMLAGTILKLMAALLCLEEDYFLEKFNFRASEHARFNYYPPCSKSDLVLGAKAHTDIGGITILLPDQKVEGLQALKDGQWIKVPIVPHALVVNAADLMEIISNGIFKSTVHRVVTNSKKERISLAIFYNPEFDQDVEPPAELIDETRPRMFRKVNIKDFHEVSYANYLLGKEPINSARI